MGLSAFNRLRERKAELAALIEQCAELGLEVVDTDDNESLKEKLAALAKDTQGSGAKMKFEDIALGMDEFNDMSDEDLIKCVDGIEGFEHDGARANILSALSALCALRDQGDGQQDPDADGVAHHDYESMTVDELRAIASQREIPYSGLKKAELIEALRAADAAV